MNNEKTKVIWIGRKKFSKDKLDKSFCTQKQSVPTAFKFYKKC